MLTILTSNVSSRSTEVLGFPHDKDDSIVTHNFFATIYSSRITYNYHTHKDEHMHDFTHRFGLILINNRFKSVKITKVF